MLSGASFLSYQNAPLKSIRDAIKDEEHHIVRVNDEGTGEIYDLNLSQSVPYASPVVHNGNETKKAQTEIDTQDSNQTVTPSSAATTTPITPINGEPITNGKAGMQEVNGSSPVSSGRRMLHLPQIVSRRHANSSNKASGSGEAMSSVVPSSLDNQDRRLNAIAPNSSSIPYQSSGSTDMPNLVRRPMAGELPPSPPLEADMQQYISSKDLELATSNEQNSTSKSAEVVIRAAPRRAVTDDPSSSKRTRRHMMREPSAVSNASTAYHSAISHDGSSEDENSSDESRKQRFTDSPLTAEPTSSFLHPSSAVSKSDNQTGTDLSRRVSPSSSIGAIPGSSTHQNAQRQPMPIRRNTTGMSVVGQPKRRAGSVGSTGTRDSRHSSRERDLLTSNAATSSSYFDEIGSGMPTAATPLRTGDAGFDEAIAKQFNQLRRERESKKMREQEVEQIQPNDNLLKGGSALVRARSGRRQTEEEPKALIGNVIGEGHVNYVLMYNMLTGIRIGVSRCQAKMKRPLTDADYMAKHKFTFDIIGNELTPSAKYDFKFKDYAPWVFRELREHFHLDAADYLLSLTSKYILSELGSPGKSGSFFYFSRDYRFIIKTIRHNEHKFLRRILKDYHLHIKENPHTLLSRFYGLHRVKLPGGKKIHFVIMNNLFPPHKDIHETYDLKGSAVGREYPEEKAAQKKGAVLKDLNWIKRGRELELGPAKNAMLEAQIRSDVALLQRLGIMDYSLLIGLHDMKRGNKEGLRQDALQVVQPSNAANTQKMTNGGPPGQLRREPTTRMEKEAYALRTAIRRSDAKALGSTATAKLPERETSDSHHFIFYQDDGGFRSTDMENRPTDWIYYFGIIDTLTLYNSVKRSEHYWKSITHNSKMISSIHPVPYGTRFCNFLFSLVKGADKSKRPRMQ